MSMLERQVARARRRLNGNLFLERLCTGVLAAAGLWTLTLLVERAFVLGIPINATIWAAGLLALGFALVATRLARVDTLRAAVAVDAALALKERISTALVLVRDPDPFARAAVADAEQRAGQVHVPAHLPYRAPGLWPWSIAAVVAAALVGFFMPELNLLAASDEPGREQARRDALVERSAIQEDLEAKLGRIREMATANPDLAALAEDLQPLEMPDEPTVTPEDVRREATQRIDKVMDKLVEQRDAAGRDALDETKRLLARLSPQSGQDLAAQLGQALAAGDFQGARQALEKLQQELEATQAQGDAAAQQQLQQMQAQLERLADQLAKLDDSTYLQKELENKAGLSAEEAKKLLEQMAQMDPKQREKELQRQLADKGLSQQQIEQMVKKFEQKQQACQNCQGLAQGLAQAAQALAQSSQAGGGSAGAAGAAASLGDVGTQLSDLEMAQQLLDELEAQLGDLQNMRQSVCSGGYCAAGGQRPNRIGPQGPEYGFGIGASVPKERTAHALAPTKARSRMQGGTIIGQMLVDGRQVRGEATAEVRDAVSSAQRDATDAIERHEVPRQYHGVVREYFYRLAGLASGNRAAPAAGAAGEPTDQDASQDESPGATSQP
jgi:colicin import membrane protein